LSDDVLDHEFAPQQPAGVVRDAVQPLLLRKLLFALRGRILPGGQAADLFAAALVCTGILRALAIRPCPVWPSQGQTGRGIATCLLCVILCRGRLPAVTGLCICALLSARLHRLIACLTRLRALLA
jgi:hypothetical protein